MEKIYFDRSINNQKPSTIRNSKISCPFCDIENLDNIIEHKDEMILIENKFPTLENSKMLVLIESSDCKGNPDTYSVGKNQQLLTYAIDKWMEYQNDPKYKSAVLFKNKGEQSSGTIKHPHMQIVAFEDIDVNGHVQIEHLQGHQVAIDGLAEFNLSDNPLISFLEINLSLEQEQTLVAKTIKFLTMYMEEIYWGPEASYNFFFYQIQNNKYLKIIPRYPTSSVTLGFGVVQIYKPELLAKYVGEITDYYQRVCEKLI